MPLDVGKSIDEPQTHEELSVPTSSRAEYENYSQQQQQTVNDTKFSLLHCFGEPVVIKIKIEEELDDNFQKIFK